MDAGDQDNEIRVVNDYTDLIAYRKAYELVLIVYKLTANFPKDEIYGLTSQVRRAAVSIPSNIAEGFMRGSKENVQFLKIALGSTAELETQISLSKDLGYCTVAEFENVNRISREVMRLIRSYIARINNRINNATCRKK